ncbi:MAG: OsmC family protein [Gemmatimonadales bacterium]|nr:OsmC family protein [Gemmatimonadales bacterium]
MPTESLRARQAPLKTRYRDVPESAVVTLRAKGAIGIAGVTCAVETGSTTIEAGLHPATGGDGQAACSGDMLLQALVACAGVTLGAVATSLGLPVRGGTVSAEGDVDFRGTLGVAKDAPVGFRSIRLRFDLAASLGEEQRATLLRLTERYCVVYQTLRHAPGMSAVLELTAG